MCRRQQPLVDQRDVTLAIVIVVDFPCGPSAMSFLLQTSMPESFMLESVAKVVPLFPNVCYNNLSS